MGVGEERLSEHGQKKRIRLVSSLVAFLDSLQEPDWLYCKKLACLREFKLPVLSDTHLKLGKLVKGLAVFAIRGVIALCYLFVFIQTLMG